MPLVIQKYGGSSVADGEKIMNVARRIARTAESGNQVVAVVSAMGDTTDDLLKIAYDVCDNPGSRELDVLLSTGEIVSSTLLAMALKSLGAKSISLTGAQAGIRTDNSYSRARITNIDPRRIIKELDKGNIVIVAGFQGINDEMDTTTLGRGGSDTTAVALAASLNADKCEIYTDVTGVYTADPRIVSQAKKLDEIGYEEMLEMSTYGANVMHPRAVELGQIYNIPILVASSFLESPGTLIHGGIPVEGRNRVTGIAQDLNVAKITIVGVPDRPGIAGTIFERLAAAGISVDTIVQNASIENITDLTFTIAKSDLAPAMEIVKPIAAEIGARDCVFDSSVGKVSIIGTGIQTSPGYAARMFATLSRESINIMLISTSEIRITCIIKEDRVKDAVRALHQAFELEQA
ncbi:MAG: aspartate kinase [Dehalococcoidales bacterium]|jgi:aspartate kinase|nr:aspartate kinase [Dehalococcoidales bacterium]MDD4229871.1 aspartate kinase [Dehalococcoidales bacterium]MDD4465073.1 aspartate kinase [Dehalococcoidales bacterium]MDD5401910.1 aspartate kinase [Dehalococcoidales bacterium]